MQLARLSVLAKRARGTLLRMAFSPKAKITPYIRLPGKPLIYLGTRYGGWCVVDDASLYPGTAILAGVGEDVSFDLGLQGRYGCNCVLVDPTPRAVAHFRLLQSRSSLLGPVESGKEGQPYSLLGVDLGSIKLLECALWDAACDLTFWAPADPSHVSYSATNLQATKSSIKVPAKTLLQVMGDAGVDVVSVLKLDIEGAELRVVDDLLASSCRPTQLLVEFDELISPTPHRVKSVLARIDALTNAGYTMFHYDGISNCSFLFATNQDTPV
jgi:hypothetical protein